MIYAFGSNDLVSYVFPVKLLVNSGEVISMTHVLQVLFLSVFILQVVMHGEESQVPGDLRQSEILIEQDFKI
jgi:hypothetical protein